MGQESLGASRHGGGTFLNFVPVQKLRGRLLVGLFGSYGPTLKRNRELFWEELGAIRGLWSDPWCIGGDFNVVRFPSERSREGRITCSMRRFSEVIEELALRDLPIQGGAVHVDWRAEWSLQV